MKNITLAARAVSALALASFALASCATTPPIGSDFRAAKESATILVMQPDVEITFLTTGGAERRSDWQDTARQNLTTALSAELQSTGETLIMHDAAAALSPEAQQAVLLTDAVTDALTSHVMMLDPMSYRGPLPHQKDQRETYTLGETVRQLAPGVEADYALFTTSRSTIESGGVFMVKVLVGAATGYTPASANWRGTYMTLVDLRTGEVVWVRGWAGGDTRNPNEAVSIVDNILGNGPLAPAAAPSSRRR